MVRNAFIYVLLMAGAGYTAADAIWNADAFMFAFAALVGCIATNEVLKD